MTLHSCYISILGQQAGPAHLVTQGFKGMEAPFQHVLPLHCYKEERMPRIVSTQKRHLPPSVLAKARHVATPRSNPTMLSGSKLRISGKCPDDYHVIIW